MNIRQRFAIMLILVISLTISGCGSGQMPGPTKIPTSSPTDISSPTLSPTESPTPTLTLIPTLTPTATATVPCTNKGWSDIDKTMLYVISDFTGVHAYLSQSQINTLMVSVFDLPTYIDGISKTDVAPCTQKDLSLILKGLNSFLDYCKYISAGAEKPGQILILPGDISKDKTNAFRAEVNNDFTEANNDLLALKISLVNFNYLTHYINSAYAVSNK